MTPSEVWRAVPEYKGLYEVSNLGRVRRLHHSRRARPYAIKKPNARGQVNLYKKGKAQCVLVRYLMTWAFREPGAANGADRNG